MNEPEPEAAHDCVRAAMEIEDGAAFELALMQVEADESAAGLGDLLTEALPMTWHQRHEDVARMLQQLRHEPAVDALALGATTKHDYLAIDDSHAFARKCCWALADIGTDRAKQALVALAETADATVAGYAQRRLDHWEEELPRKGPRNPAPVVARRRGWRARRRKWPAKAARRMSARTTLAFGAFGVGLAAFLLLPIRHVILFVRPEAWVGAVACLQGAWWIGARLASFYQRASAAGAAWGGAGSGLACLVIGAMVGSVPGFAWNSPQGVGVGVHEYLLKPVIWVTVLGGLPAMMIGAICGLRIRARFRE